MSESCENCWKCLKYTESLSADELHARLSAGKKTIGSSMILCPDCGNKRCPKASDHELPCTGSNESGQPGSVYQ